MAVHGDGALAGWFDHEGETNVSEWLAKEHIGERVASPGFVRGRRFESATSRPQYFMFYETDHVEVFASPSYLERLNNPTDWSRRSSAGLRNMTRTICRITATIGRIDGGAVATCECSPDAGDDGRSLREWISKTLLPDLVGTEDIYSAHLLEADQGISRIETEEKRLRGGQDEVADWVVVVEGRSEESVLSATATLPDRLSRHGAVKVKPPRSYKLSFAASANDFE